MFKHTIELALGNIEIYKKEAYGTTDDSRNGYYWVTTNNYIDEHGPFPSIYDTGRDYANKMKASHALPPKAPLTPTVKKVEIETQVIMVDFAGKKRIS